jgi:hypothetical protein
MPKSVTLTKRATSVETTTGNVLLVIEVTSGDSMEKEVFVKQRIPKPNDTFSDVFVAVATPVQMEDLDINSPAEGTSYFRCADVSLVCFSAEYANTVWETIQTEVAMLVKDLNDMETLSPTTTVVI